jgi:hypothetical protein
MEKGSNNSKKLLEMIKINNFKKARILKEPYAINKTKSPSYNIPKFPLNSRININDPNTNNNQKNFTEIHFLKYRPKRLTTLKEQGYCKLPLTNIGGASVDFEKTFSSREKKKNLYHQKSENSFNNMLDNKNLVNYNNDSEFKAKYILKLTKNSQEFNKLESFGELINDNDNRRIFTEIFSKLSKLIDYQTKIYINNNDYNSNNNISIIKNYNVSPLKVNDSIDSSTSRQPIRNNSNLNLQNYLGYTSNTLNNKSITNSTSFTSSNNINLKKLMIFWSEFIPYINKLLTLIFSQYSSSIKENTKLQKVSYNNERKLTNKANELDELKRYLNRFDINMKINQQIQKKKEIKELKQSFNKRENEYILSIYKLENEIKNLVLLLDKNKGYYDEYKNVSKEIEKNKKQCEILKNKLNKELQESNTKFLIEKDNQEELKFKIEELNKEINEMKLEREIWKKNNIEMQAKLKKMEMILGEKEENIVMLNEELEYYLRKYTEEKFHHNNIKNEFHILEKKLYNLEEEPQKKNESFTGMDD